MKSFEQPDDTDWFVHDLYNFAADLGITTIHAKYSRLVIDLNRDPRQQTALHRRAHYYRIRSENRFSRW